MFSRDIIALLCKLTKVWCALCRINLKFHRIANSLYNRTTSSPRWISSFWEIVLFLIRTHVCTHACGTAQWLETSRDGDVSWLRANARATTWRTYVTRGLYIIRSTVVPVIRRGKNIPSSFEKRTSRGRTCSRVVIVRIDVLEWIDDTSVLPKWFNHAMKIKCNFCALILSRYSFRIISCKWIIYGRESPDFTDVHFISSFSSYPSTKMVEIWTLTKFHILLLFN